MKELSIIIPVYNQYDILVNNLPIIKEALKDIDYEIIVVNDGSTDDLKIKGIFGDRIKYISYEINCGKGQAVMLGMVTANGKYRLFMDADLSTPIFSIYQALQKMIGGKYDVLIPYRDKSTQPILRRTFGWLFYIIASSLLKSPVKDINGGFKLYTADAADLIFNKLTVYRWAFDVEALYIAQYYNLKIAEMPVIWHHNKSSRVKLFRDIFYTIYELFKIKKNIMGGIY